MDTFYNTRSLPFAQKIELLKECRNICQTWWVDKLDCSISFARQRIDISFEEIMEKFSDSAHFVVIDRKFHPLDEVKHFEIGFSAMTSPIDYFLFIWVEDEKMPEILRKYNMNLM
ncbi:MULTISPECIES: hypothetical protein [unclassified Parabacteroides]|nr:MULTISPECIES: hypothetical protein [unclassified Parabacteroides]